MNRILALCLICNFLLAGCNKKNGEPHNKAGSSGKSFQVKYANGFTIENIGTTRVITVADPWQHAAGIQYRYLLSDTFTQSEIIDALTSKIRTPVKRVVCLSTTHIGFISFLGEISTVYGISGRNYIVNESLRRRCAVDSTFDVGYDENLNYELLLKLKPDVVFAYGISRSVTNTIKKINELGIPVVMIGEYLEMHPLAKMEWVKVFAAFYNKEDEASVRFNLVAGNYNRLTGIAANSGNKPAVLLGLPWRGTWYVSGSQSYVACLIKDAGGKYIWDHLQFNESRPMALEKIFENALSSDFWLNPGDVRSKEEILTVDERFDELSSYKNDKVFNNNNIQNQSGGNAFFETGVVEPDLILSDLIYILHPQLLPSHTLKYYRKLQ
jgi:iron complex transport system substrate-binding protein